MQVYSLAQNYNNKKLKQSTPSNSALYNSILPLTEAIFISLQSIFYIILPSITRPDNSNFLFPLKVRIIGSRLYLINLCPILAPTVKRQQQQQQNKTKTYPPLKKRKTTTKKRENDSF